MQESKFHPATVDVFNFLGDSYQPHKLYYAFHQRFPNLTAIEDIDSHKFTKWAMSGELVFDQVIERRLVKSVRKASGVLMHAIYVLDNGILIDHSRDELKILFDERNAALAHVLIEKIIKKCREGKTRTGRIYLIVQDRVGINIKPVRLPNPTLQISRHYNDDLPVVHNAITLFLKQMNAPGLILLHGQPGTGKSTYIRFLIQQTKKKVLFLSPVLAASLDNPSLMTLLMENRESIIVVEDAEDLLVSRENKKNDAISTLLNLTDGLLGNSLGIQFIATFNTHIRNIDKALLRKGRLAAMYEFKPLAAHKATELLKSIDSANPHTDKPLTLAEIYHTHDIDHGEYKEPKQTIGFLSRHDSVAV